MSNRKFFLLILLLVVAVGLCALLFFVVQKNQLALNPVHRFLVRHENRTLGERDVNRIQSWMTFDYLNKVFRLPPDYLKNDLAISNAKYPNVTIDEQAEQEHVKPVALTVRVQEAIHYYLVK